MSKKKEIGLKQPIYDNENIGDVSVYDHQNKVEYVHKADSVKIEGIEYIRKNNCYVPVNDSRYDIVERKETIKPYLTAEETEKRKKELVEMFNKKLGIDNFYIPFTCGWQMLVYIYERDENFMHKDGTKSQLFIPSAAKENDKYINCVALVLDQGCRAYRDSKFDYSGPYCHIGDWIVFPRNEGSQWCHMGITVQTIPDDRPLNIVKDPTHATRN